MSIDFDFKSGNFKIKIGYVPSIINDSYRKNHVNASYVKSITDTTYLRDNIILEEWYKNNFKCIGETILRRFGLC